MTESPTPPPLVLASQSPRRAELIGRLGLQFETLPADIDESYFSGETPSQHAERLSREKAQKIAAERPDAVFCVNDQLALGVLDACRFDLGLACPDDVSVVGFDDVSEAGHQSFSLTTVRQQVDAMARATVELLLRRRKAPNAPARAVLLPGELVRRSSARI